MTYAPTATGEHLRIAIAADHNGVQMKSHLVALLLSLGHSASDLGTHGPELVDYPILCVRIGKELATGAADRGIMIGGSGMGEVIACNKVKGVRAGLCADMFQVGISRGNNDSNVLVLGAKVLNNETAAELTSAWLTTSFNGGVHQKRLEQIAQLESGEEPI